MILNQEVTTPEIVSEILSPYELTRLFSLLHFLSVAEANFRAVNLTLRGLREATPEIAGNRDLAAAVDAVEGCVERYTQASTEVWGAITHRHKPSEDTPTALAPALAKQLH